MTSRSRLLLVLATVIILAGGFVLASQAAEDETPQTPASATTTEAKPEAGAEPDEPTATTGTRTEAQETEAAPAPKPRIPTLVVEDGRPRGEVRTLTFDKGERVRFRVRSDVPEELHIHGYDRYVDVGPGKTTTVSFPATIEGIFEVELHGAGAQLASLRVEP